MARRLRPRAAASAQPAEVLVAPAQALPVPDASVDTVVTTLVLCTVPDVGAALAEVRRVLAPGGRLLFLEHVRHPRPQARTPQDRWNPIQQRIAHGCNVNRPTPDLIAQAGFTLHDVRQDAVPQGAVGRPAADDRERHGVSGPWAGRELHLIGVGGAPA